MRAESERASDTAAQLYGSAPLFSRLQQRLRPRVCPFEQLVPEIRNSGGRMLDFGCGAALFGLHCLTEGYVKAVDGVDVSASALEVAEAARHLAADGENVRFRLGEIPESTYDVISMIDVMHHISPVEQRTTFLGLCDSLAPGGVLVYKDMCRRPRWQALANRLHDLILNREWIHYVPIDQVVEWAGTAGLTLERRTSFDYLVYGHELAVFRRAD
ncbi:MAG: class I SAM-dependent methyltransferase [Acidimicrobiia bacterium]|nr:class I SAM-dependent methyltransferase [Acidimicrobiia bacterium]